MSDMEEPLSAILAEMKRRADEAHDGLNGVADTNQIDYMEVEDWADRIEATVKWERAFADFLLAVRDKPLPHPDPDNAPPLFAAPGNAAALRAALQETVLLSLKVGRSIHGDVACGIMASKARAALAAPARNCDVGTAEEQAERFEAECKRHDHCTPCPVHREWGEFKEGKPKSCQMIWAQMPYAPEGGSAKCVNGLRGDPDCRGCEEHCLDVRKRNCFYWNPDIGKCALDGKPSCRISCGNFHVAKEEKPGPAEGGKE